MNNLFTGRKIREQVEAFKAPDFDKKLQVLKDYYDEWVNGDLASRTEETEEQNYNDKFFVKVLGYEFGKTIKPKAKTESGKPDLTIRYEGKNKAEVISAVVELKSGKTDLDRPQQRERNESPVDQAFRYKNGVKSCPFVIVSNFYEIRLYRNFKGEYEVWTLRDLVDSENNHYNLRKLLFLLSKDRFLKKSEEKQSDTEKILDDIRAEEEKLTKAFYKKYKSARHKLLQNLYKNNNAIRKDPDLLIEKGQKVVDRIIFSCFCEDKKLLPAGTLQDLAKRVSASYSPAWQVFQGFFQAIDKGNPKLEILEGYNGGLFANDKRLNSLKIDNEPLNSLLELGRYDFEDDLSVNILGHIFEQSITDLEDIKDKIRKSQGKIADVGGESKRKKDGVFYTPDYVVSYMVENTLGAYLREIEESIKDELGLKEGIIKRNYEKREAEVYNRYKDVLNNIKVLDPACGSGAFLVGVFDFLLKEHTRVGKILKTLFDTTEIYKEILQNNIYGVDLNQESVEITKLSLWLKTAQKNKKLNNLDNNIKCGNSLIENEIAKEKAFSWGNEFPNIISKGGFDVVVGNPPWGASFTDAEKDFLKSNYPHSSVGKVDSYKYFYEKAISLTRKNGYLSFITPNTFLYNIQSKSIREAILNNCQIDEAIELRKNIFEDAPDVVPAILKLKKEPSNQHTVDVKVAYPNIKITDLASNEWELSYSIDETSFKNDSDRKINLRQDIKFLEIKHKLSTLDTVGTFFDTKQGTKPYGSKQNKSVELIGKDITQKGWDKAVNGRNLSPYHIDYEDDYVKNCDELHSKIPQRVLDGDKIYFQRMRKISLFPRIVAAFDKGEYHGLYTCSVIYPKEGLLQGFSLKSLLCILNSKLINLWYKYFDTDVEIKLDSVQKVPVPSLSTAQDKELSSLADKMMNNCTAFRQKLSQVVSLIQAEAQLEKATKKIQSYYTLSSSDFLKEISVEDLKKKEKILAYFEKSKKETLLLKEKVDNTELEINQTICKIYGLNKEQIKLIERS